MTAAIVLVLVVFGAAAAVGAQSSAVDKSEAVSATPQAVVVGPTSVTPVVYVVTGMNFPDALGAGPVAGITDGPILLVLQNSIPVETATELTRLNPDRIVIVGGTGVVSTGVETSLGGYAATVERLSGSNRFETAAKVSAANFPAAHTFMVYDGTANTTAIGANCTSYAGLAVPITVPGPGTIVVEANIDLYIDHVPQGPGQTEVDLWIGTSATDCTSDTAIAGDMLIYLMQNEPTGGYWPWVTMKKVMHVETAGTHTFYATGKHVQGTDAPFFYWGHMDATFIPDPGA
jgi:hypothetical protein